jgi:hypothetical protein
MAKTNFNLFKYGTWATINDPAVHNTGITPERNGSHLVAGGGNYTMSFSHGTVYTDGQYGLIYNVEAKLNCIVSVAVRSAFSTGEDFESVGLIMRTPFLFPPGTKIGPANRNYYQMGLYRERTDAAGPYQLRLYRTLFGTRTQLGASQFIPSAVNNEFVQFAMKIENDISDDVELSFSYNTGSALSNPTPGSGDWTAWSLVATDSGHGGILNQSGYYGFGSGWVWTSNTSSNRGWSYATLWDQWRIEDL